MVTKLNTPHKYSAAKTSLSSSSHALGNLKRCFLSMFLCLSCAQCVAQAALPSASAEQESATASSRLPPAAQALALAAEERTKHWVRYDGRYLKMAYPGGDVPANMGVCTDVVIRSYRSLGVDLQQLVHEDMTANFNAYPKNWGLSRPDTNIDHRRVPNLRRYFERQGYSLKVSQQAKDYQPGDLVTWRLSNNLPHIGIVSSRKSHDGERFLVVHNIGLGPKFDDFLFAATITGHYRFLPESANELQ